MTAPDDTQDTQQPPSPETTTQAHPRPIAPDPSLEAPSQALAAEGPSPSQPEETLHDRVVRMLTTIYDPEIPVNIYEMGLIYDLDINPDGDVAIKMTLTAPTCPVAESLPPEVEAKVGSVEGVRSVKVELTWEPPWTPERMGEAAKLELGYL
jgi:FeS assembly SUF system protein